MKKRIFSGAQPTGELHIGNYLGALRNWVSLQNEYESLFCIVNLHAITLPQDPKVLKQKTLDLARIYLASGIDPQKSTVFIQSDAPEHAELAWVLSCVARMGELERMTQFKEKSQRSTEEETLIYEETLQEIFANASSNAGIGTEEFLSYVAKESLRKFNIRERTSRAGVGLFTYPVLMASDILLYQTDLVPVGQDQKQHLELTRDLAERFNRDFGSTFKIPNPFIPSVGAKIMSLQDPSKKMSKSDKNPNGAIFLLDSPDAISKKFKRAVTDSGTGIYFDESRPAITNLLTIYQLLTGKSREECENHFDGKGYGHFKTELADVAVEFLKPFQKRVKEFDDIHLENILKKGARKARRMAQKTLKDVYKKMGVN